MDSNKKYGLQMPQKFIPGQMKPKLSIFNDESSDSDDQGGTALAAVNKALQKQSLKTYEKKQTKIDIARALQDDPTVYQYDELYDDMDRKREEVKVKNKEDRKPKYIQSLLLQAERRKREHERRTERQVQKEREAEGEEFKDKESFVTSAYREKLEEFKKMEEEEQYQDQLEAFTEVSKQKDLSGFYRHLYRQTVSGEKNKPTVENDQEENSKSNGDQSETDKEENLTFKKRKRKYRERKSSSSSEDVEEKNIDKTLDVDSANNSSSISSESENENEEITKKEKKKEIKYKKQKLEHKEVIEKIDKKDDNENNSDEPSSKSNKKSKELKEKLDIWKKRTVGEKLENALERYFERKKIIMKELELTGSFQESPYIKPEKYKYF